MGRILAGGWLLPLILQGHLAGQQPRNRAATEAQEPAARVEIVAFEANGKFLGAPNVSVFEPYDHRNLAARFRDGVANGVPYGVYRIEGRLPGCSSDVRYVRVYQPTVMIVLGLEFGVRDDRAASVRTPCGMVEFAAQVTVPNGAGLRLRDVPLRIQRWGWERE